MFSSDPLIIERKFLMKSRNKIFSIAIIIAIVVSLFPAITLPAVATNYLYSGNKDLPKLTKGEIAELLTNNPPYSEADDFNDCFDVVPSTVYPYSAGKVKDILLQKTVNRLNALRRLAGLNSVVLDNEMNEDAQYGAVLLTVSNFGHYPSKPNDMDDGFYQKALSATSTSNIHCIQSSSSKIVSGCLVSTPDNYMEDSDISNVEGVGHRRWQLNPTMGKTGFGCSYESVGGTTIISSCEKAFDRSGSTIDYDFIAWPASGNFPSNVFGYNGDYNAWSVTLNPDKYSQPVRSEITVTLSRNSDGEIWTFSGNNSYEPSNYDEYFNVNYKNYGIDNCIIFRPSLLSVVNITDEGAIFYEGLYTVTINGLKDKSGNPVDFAYQVNFFDPTSSALSKSMFTVNTSAEIYNGTAKTKLITSSLTEGEDYTVAYSNNVNAGNATITITGKGLYSGSLTYTFPITKAARTITASGSSSNLTAGGAHGTISVNDNASGNTSTYSYTSSNGRIATVSSTGEVTPLTPGDVTITVNAAATANFEAGSATVSFTVGTLPSQELTFSTPDSVRKTYGDAAFTNAAVNNTAGGGAISYSSSNQNIVTVNQTTGEVTIVGAGTATITATASEVAEKYAQTSISYALTVAKAVPVLSDFSITTPSTVDYTGSPVSVTAPTSGKAGMGRVSVKYNGNSNPPINAGSYTVTFDVAEGTNYTAASGLTVGTLVINKVDHNDELATGESKYGSSGILDLSSKIAAGATVTVAETEDNDSVLNGDVTITNGVLNFAFVNDISKADKTASVTLSVTDATNYNNYKITVTLNVLFKFVQKDFKLAESSKTVSYIDPNFTVTASGEVDGSVVTYSSSDESIATVNAETGEVSVISAGTAYIRATASETDDYAVATKEYLLSVIKSQITITALNQRVYLNGTLPELNAPEKGTHYTITGIRDGDELRGNLALAYQSEGRSVTPDVSAIGSYDIVASGAEVPNANNYETIINYINGALTIIHRPSINASGGGSGNSSGSDDKDTKTSSQTKTNSDGSVTTTTTRTTTNPDGTTKLTITTETKTANGTTGTTVTDENGKWISSEAIISQVDLNKALENNDPIVIPLTVDPTSSSGSEVIKITLPDKSVGNNRYSSVSEMPVVEIPLTETAPGVVAMLRSADGRTDIIKECYEGSIIFPIENSCEILIVDNTKYFSDVAAESWYASDVAFVTAREIFNGVGDGRFSPTSTMNRAMIAQVLYNFDRYSTASVTNAFSDVKATDWFASAVGWASNNSIVSGYGTVFAAADAVTRQDLVTILYRYAKGASYDVSRTTDLSAFSDENIISDYAKDAMRWAVASGVIGGYSDETIRPTATATRAEVAAIMARFVRNVRCI